MNQFVKYMIMQFLRMRTLLNQCFRLTGFLPEPTNLKTVFTFTLLDNILLGTPASPLRKKLIESGLGEDLTGGGLETHLKQMCYSVGLKGIEIQIL